MHLPIELWIYLAAFCGACLGFFSAVTLAARKRTGLYNRGWNAGRDFARKNPDA